jgi:hypothetical protein
VLAHRFMLREEERLRGVNTEDVLQEIVDRCPVPGPIPAPAS